MNQFLELPKAGCIQLRARQSGRDQLQKSQSIESLERRNGIFTFRERPNLHSQRRNGSGVLIPLHQRILQLRLRPWSDLEPKRILETDQAENPRWDRQKRYRDSCPATRD